MLSANYRVMTEEKASISKWVDMSFAGLGAEKELPHLSQATQMGFSLRNFMKQVKKYLQHENCSMDERETESENISI